MALWHNWSSAFDQTDTQWRSQHLVQFWHDITIRRKHWSLAIGVLGSQSNLKEEVTQQNARSEKGLAYSFFQLCDPWTVTRTTGLLVLQPFP